MKSIVSIVNGFGEMNILLSLYQRIFVFKSLGSDELLLMPKVIKPSSRAMVMLMICAGLVFSTQPATAQSGVAATTDTDVGDTVTNPVTNMDVTVVALIKDNNNVTASVITSDNQTILTQTMVGDTISRSDGGDPPVFADYEVITANTNATSMLVESVDIRLSSAAVDDPTENFVVVAPAGGDVTFNPPSVGPDIPPVVPPISTSGVINEIYRGASGGDGSDGGGFEICDPTGLFGGCTFIGVEPEKGGDGKKPADVNRTIASSYNGGNAITSTGNNTPGITIGAVGGDGGQGGDGIVLGGGANGGNGGAGGNVNVVNNADVSVGGNDSYGLYVYSQAGTAGPGGDSIGLGGTGGDGGAAKDGGTVVATNNADLTTSGNFGHAIRVFSSGGGAGDGGGGWGIVGGSGNGATGGNGGAVTANNNGTLRTSGNNANGILAQSIGGSGGDSGSAGGIVALGGVGSGGGNGSTANVNNNGSITTTGDNSKGILAQSIGGGGGTGSDTGGLVALSGAGGQAGNGSNVRVTNGTNGAITTTGDYSDGIYAQSIGGSGGSGGSSGGIVASGASGGGSGNAGTVRVDNSGSIRTEGDFSRGILVQSIGGGGGSGGSSGGLVALAGDGGGSGIGRAVTVINNASGDITTTGQNSAAIYAQSIGGGGGSGGSTGGLVAIAASGGGAGQGGTVSVTNRASLITEGTGSRGIEAQSIGGGGGGGGGAGGLVALSGSGGGASAGSSVTINNSGSISTGVSPGNGIESDAIFAQSVGGGGGSGAGSGGLVSISGSGGGAGAGGNVRVTNSGELSTIYNDSFGIFAQSVGGGGGSGGGSGGLVALGGNGGGAASGGTVTVTNNNGGNVTTVGDRSSAIQAQSVGGGGGSGAGAGGLVAIGGDAAGGAGNGSVVTVSNTATLITQGTQAKGIFAQSIGGGGGSGAGAGGLVAISSGGGGAGSGGVVNVTNSGRIITGVIGATGIKEESDAIFAQSIGGGGGSGAGSGGLVSLSGSGGGAGAGNTVTVINSGQLDTRYDDSNGIFAQSVGGGGGSGGGSGGLVALGGDGGGAANGGAVSVTNNNGGDITTLGDRSGAIHAQSVGGGGGSGSGSGGLVALGGSAGGAGNGANVTVRSAGNLRTLGTESIGIFAQSIGGGGGSGGASGGLVALGGGGGGSGNGGVVGVTNSGTVITGIAGQAGDGSTAIFAQSIGGSGGNGAPSGGLVALGGNPGGGVGNGGIVSVVNSGALQTFFDDSFGIFAESVGGGGGSGGASGGLVALAGDGGGAGFGGNVTVDNALNTTTNLNGGGSITTSGDRSSAIFAHSIGGGGGYGRAAGGLVSLGGDAGAGSYGGNISVSNDAALTTSGVSSSGIYAQSVGGGGGSAGEAGALVALAGDGGGAGYGGTVEVINRQGGDISTSEKNSSAIFAESIGGGGGDGVPAGGLVGIGGDAGGGEGYGGAVTVINEADLSTLKENSRGIYAHSIGGGGGRAGEGGGLVGLGGDGGSGSYGGAISVENTGDIKTEGLNSIGIFAQSVGGGGGDAGDAGGLVSLGGDGNGTGANGGTVDVISRGAISTLGTGAKGIFAESVGGGGGEGGTAGGVFATIGGKGGAGSLGGAVSVTKGGTINTQGINALGIHAQSVGGGGGDGGGAYSGSLFAGFSLGGDGAIGGIGGNVEVVLEEYIDGNGNLVPTSIITENERSTGILAQSVGGGGGSGGKAVQATIGAFVSLSAAIGGDGAGGGRGGTVDFSGAGNVTTMENLSPGVVLQSVGGGGGNGGTTVSASLAVGTGVSVSGSLALGGSAGDASEGGTVTADIDTIIRTGGEFSTAFLAQSVGGGGGNGGTTVSAAASLADGVAAGIGVGIGGNAGGGGDGGEVDVELRGEISTQQAQSDGIVVQSIGGGGGNAGTTIAATLAAAGGVAANVSVGVGGDGGAGGQGNKASAVIVADVSTRGDGSDGVIVQSIGGGGGNSGLTVGAGLAGAGGISGSINVGVGGSGETGGDGGIVELDYTGTLSTEGSNATGILAQSVGGGGGNSSGTIAGGLSGAGGAAASVNVSVGGDGGAGGDGGKDGTVRAVTAITEGIVSTDGENSAGIVIQSIGGGGGNGGYAIAGGLAGGGVAAGAIDVALGGSGEVGGVGKEVYADIDTIVMTEQARSTGVLVQSVGGGGGNGGFSVAAGLAGAGVGSGTVSVGLGGGAGDGNIGGDVIAFSRKIIVTLGDQSGGFVAQSVGGGGGNGGFNVAASLSGAGVGSGAINVGLGGDGGEGSHSGSVTAQVSADVVTYGTNSVGILAQSQAGGGGNASFNVAAGLSGAGVGSGAIDVGLGGEGGASGDAGAVTLTVTNDVYTFGGDGSGLDINSPTYFTDLIAQYTDAIVANRPVSEDANSSGIIAQSIGGGGGNGGVNVTASGSGAGVGSGGVSVGLGGDGAGGGSGGKVVADITGQVLTVGNGSDGVLAQSVGGGGGNGAVNVTGTISGAGIGNGAVTVGLGGEGGAGSTGGEVDLDLDGSVYTFGDRARGVIAQSIGGGGGNGAINVGGTLAGAGTGSGDVTVAIGGSGGSGATSGLVNADVEGDITTTGDFSDGFIAQTIGGGGGNSAINIGAAISGAGTGNGSVKVGLGGTGGTGANSNVVNANYDGDLRTEGDFSRGMLVQSIGGGGGSASGNIAAGLSGAGTGNGDVTVGLGGDGGAAGDGGLAGTALAVTAVADGQIVTLGNDSGAFIAQSIGGGGGSGGFNVSASGSGAGTGAGGVAVGLGGGGSGGGNGKGVDADIFSNIFTQGNNSSGVLVQSVGGGGGNGGFNVTAALVGAGTGAAGVAVGLGGDGDLGGNAGQVNADASGTISTLGNNSAGFVAQSIGGGGGNGGFNVNVGLAGAGTGSGAIAVGLGGGGAAGGESGEVYASTADDVTTAGNDSAGVIAQSIGGGGGNGAFNVNVSGAAAGTGSGAIGVGLGGAGAVGNDGNKVELTVDNDVITQGANSNGILAQSLGGGGGNGGFNVNVNLAASGKVSGALGVGLGGSGDGGGNGGEVVFDGEGSVITGDVDEFLLDADGQLIARDTTVAKGDNSSGIVIQSIGGGGGNGGFDVSVSGAASGKASGALSVGLGGNGAGGGNGGVVDSTFIGDIRTAGFSAKGLLVQSVGGGGGNGAFNVSVGLAAAGTGSGALGIGLGGSGDGGGFGGMASSESTGNVVTFGDYSTGVTVQSMGGGGGSGGFSVAGTVSAAKTGSGSLSIGLGGSGGSGGAGGIVENSVIGDVATYGVGSGGVLAQSVGGGGGNGGFSIAGAISLAKTAAGALSVGIGGSGDAGGVGAMVTNSVIGNVFTQGDEGFGIVAQSIGGGGGSGGLNISGTVALAKDNAGALGIGVGGFGGAGGAADDVDNTVVGFVQTQGDNAGGILAQSLGGGGGNGGLNVTGNITASKKANGSLGVGVGGFGGQGGLATNVTNDVTGGVETFGNNSDGIIAQSLGGGGGNGGLNVTGILALSKSGSTGALGVGIGGFGADGGNSGVVTNTVTMTEDFDHVTTQGNESFGIIAQSIAGGGGNGGLNVTGNISASMEASTGSLGVGIGGFGGDGGESDDVINTVTGFVQTQGDNSGGILAQSLGGGGGNGGINVTGNITASKKSSGNLAVGIGGFGGEGGLSKNVTNTVTGAVETVGNNSDGIVAQSLGGGGGNGGINVTGSLSLSSEGSTGAIGVGIGGFGANGGDSGVVRSTVIMTEELDHVTTQGNNSSAVIAQSIGGGGGNGALNVTGTISASKKSGASVGIGIGGFGGGAGDGDEVYLSVDGLIQTQGSDSHGLVAQSIGGGGGNGGTNVTGSIGIVKSDQSATAIGAAIGVGGFGGGGGDAKKVEVSHNGSIMVALDTVEYIAESTDPDTGVVTPGKYVLIDVPGVLVPESTDPVSNEVTPEFLTGEGLYGSHGLVAQSIGGGGGNGGTNVSGSIAYGAGDDTSTRGLVIGVGGFGGAGGETGSVEVDVTGSELIFAAGVGRSGVLAQSIGGGGGDGATNVSGAITSDAPLVVGVGGFGGNAGVGQMVDVNVDADIIVVGADTDEDTGSAGILAQSIGGGGGNGGLNVSGGLSLSKDTGFPSVTLGVGGFGGTGASSSQVDVVQVGQIDTSGSWTNGVLAQSIAGGGGNGGLNVSGSLNKADSDATGGKTDIAIVAGVGGTAGAGANAGNVTVNQDGAVTTTGDYSRGVAAQSIGGGGGNGGMNITTLLAQKSSPVSIGVGGSGGGGGHAGNATVNRGDAITSTGKIYTQGYDSAGIEASSIGGGGGNAGMNFNLAYTKSGKTVDDKDGFAANFVIGGDGENAGNGADAAVTNYSDIETLGEASHGIISQSIGGGGGNATFNMAATFASSSTSTVPATGLKGKLLDKVNIVKDKFSKGSTGEADADERKDNENLGFSLTIGGGTGDGGSGSQSDVVHQGNITTAGDNAYGILSQSIGGGGGNVGMDMALVMTGGGALNIKIGREGGLGGSGGDVTIDSNGAIQTSGDNSYGLLAQSIGNGGGNSSATQVSGSFPSKDDDGEQQGNTMAVTVGLEGGLGGVGGAVDLIAAGSVTTEGDKAHAIFAQSVGGGGGNAGAASTAGLTAAVFTVSVGGTGGEGGEGGIVNVDSSAQVRTLGEQAIGILAQSIGGAGGTGGASRGGGLKSTNSGIEVNVGGSGGKGMIANTVTVDNSGVIITSGVGAHSILAQSIGGGGGIAGSALNIVGKSTSNSSSRAVVVVGGQGGEGAEGGEVMVTNTGGIGTEKSESVGILAQSIGGGGGNASAVTVTTATGKSGNNLSLAIGGSGGEGGLAKKVTVMNLAGGTNEEGGIITLGANSHGIMAMSIGGGGGTGSSSTTLVSAATSDTSTTNSLSFSLGGSGGTGGTGGEVLVKNEGGVVTYGDRAHGILAQSVGGGGGNGGKSVIAERPVGSSPDAAAAAALSPIAGDDGKAISVAIGGSGGKGNTSGLVTVDNSGDIVTNGDQSYGIFAQSIGGGGGDGALASVVSKDILKNPKTDLAATLSKFALGGFGGTGADAGDVIVNNSGSITANGDDAIGIFAQSVGGGGGNVGVSISSPIWTAASLLVDQGFGARDGSEGEGGTVTVTNTGDIVMTGARSNAIVVQSINGGGGNTELFLDVSQKAVELGADGIVVPEVLSDIETITAFVTANVTAGAEKVSDAIGLDSIVSHVGDVALFGKESLGVLIQSVGGGGGSSTTNVFVAQDGDQTVDLEAALGGSQVTNSGGGNVDATRAGNLLTEGERSQGGSIHSIGGGGGKVVVAVVGQEQSEIQAADEGVIPLASVAESLSLSDGSVSTTTNDLVTEPILTNAVAMSAILGASGGQMNDGGDVAVTSSGLLMTLGDYAPGMVIQSIGGGGGDLSLSGIVDLDIALGGIQAVSGDAGTVTYDNSGAIITAGELSHGLVLQSIGGGGGLAITDTESDAIALTLNADNAGDGQVVTLQQTGGVEVFGDRAYGIIAQSLGGGGGVVDDIFLGSAGGEGSAAEVNISIEGDAVTFGTNGVAIFGQSAGKLGADDVGFSVIGDIGAVGDYSTGLIGRSESEAESGGIGVGIEGDVFATGDHAVGLDLALVGLSSTQSIDVSAFGVLSTGDNSIAVLGATKADIAESLSISLRDSVVVDGFNAVGVDYRSSGVISSGDVSFDIGDSIVVNGASTTGLLAISDASSGRSGNITLDLGGSISSVGSDSVGVDYRSLGVTSSGDIGFDIGDSIVVDGVSTTGLLAISDSSSGRSGNVTLDLGGSISSLGSDSVGVDLSSLAGQVSGDIDAIVGGSVIVRGYSAEGLTALTQSDGLSGAIDVQINGSVSLSGNNTTAVELISSAGGSAGDVDFNLANSLSSVGSNNVALSIESIGGASAGNVDAVIGGNIQSSGGGSTAVFLSSDSRFGRTGQVSLSVRGDTSSTGNNSTAIVAESTAGGNSGGVSVNVAGSVLATGNGGIGISTASTGTSGGNINIDTARNELIFAGVNGTAVLIDGSQSSNNTLRLNGPTMTEDGLFGTPVVGIAGSDRVTTNQFYLGQFDLGGGTNRFVNNGQFVAGPEQSLGRASNVLLNNGELILGDGLNAQTVNLAGSFEQSSTGVTYSEIDFSTGEIDQVLATGTADLDGEVRVSLLSPQLIGAGDFSRVLFGGSQGVIDSDLELITAPSVIVNYGLDYSSGVAATLAYNVDFSPNFVGSSLTPVGDYLNNLQNAGSSSAVANEIITLLYVDNEDEYIARLSSLLPDFYAEQQAQLLRANQSFSNRLLSCKQADGNHRYNQEGTCGWIYVGYESLEHSPYDDFRDANFDSDHASIGGQMALGKDWHLGLAVSKEDIVGQGNSGAWSSQGDTKQIGVSLKYHPSAWKLSGVATYATNDTDTVRSGQLIEQFVTQVSRDTDALGLMLNAAHDYEFKKSYLRPALQLGYLSVDADAANETGANALSLQLRRNEQDFSWLTPSVEAGYEHQFTNKKSMARLYARLGYQYYIGDEYSDIRVDLQGVDVLVDPIYSQIELGQDTLQGIFGLDFLFGNKSTLQFQYRYEESDNIELKAGQVKFSVPF